MNIGKVKEKQSFLLHCIRLALPLHPMKKPDRETIGEVLRFAMVGVVATALHYGVYFALYHVMNESVAYTIGYGVSFILNYLLSARFTFKKHTSVRNGAGFAAAHAFNYLLQVSLLNIFFLVGISKPLAPIPVYCIAVPTNFLIVRLVFRGRGKSKDKVTRQDK